MKKKLIIGIIIIVVAGGLFFYFQIQNNSHSVPGGRILNYCSDADDKEMDCETCARYGKIFLHSFSTNCEMKAKDAWKQCTYDNECIKNNCSYSGATASSGTCSDYMGKYDGEENCHHPKESNVVICDFSIS